MKSKKKHNRVGKIIVGITGLIFFFYGSFLASLLFFGTPTQVKITSFRREMGERNETIRNSYTFVYSYEFTVAGKMYSGNSRKVKNPNYLKNTGNSYISVHYIKCCPVFNCPKDDFSPHYKILIYFAVSAVMFFFISKMK